MKQYKLKLQRIIASGEEEVPEPFDEIAYLEEIPRDRIFEYPGKEGYYKVLKSEEIFTPKFTGPGAGAYSSTYHGLGDGEIRCNTPVSCGQGPTFTIDPLAHLKPRYPAPGGSGVWGPKLGDDFYKRMLTDDSDEPTLIGPVTPIGSSSLEKSPFNRDRVGKVEPNESNAQYYLQKAQEAMQQRATLRDRPTGERSMKSTVAAFNALTGRNLTESEGWEFMVLLKMVRGRQGKFNADDYVDGSAYFGLLGESNAKSRQLVV